MPETRKASRSNKADRQTIENRQIKAEGLLGKNGVATVPIFLQPSVIRYPTSVARLRRLFLPFDFLKIRVHHIIISRFC